MSQPKWKCIGHIGDVDPIAYGGAFVYIDETGICTPEMTWFEPGPDEEWKDRRGETRLETYRVILEIDPPSEWWYDKLAEVAQSGGSTVEELQEASSSANPLAKACLYGDLIHYFGAFEFDQYPVTITEDEAYQKYGAEMKLIREVQS